MASFDDAAQALDEGRWDDAASILCEQWAAQPSARVAKLVALIDARIPRISPIEGRTVKNKEAHWVELAEEKDPAALPALLAEPWPVRAAFASDRVEALAEWPRSARIATALLELHRRRPYQIEGYRVMEFTKAGKELARRCFEILLAWEDPAAGGYLDELERDGRPEAAHERDVLAEILERPRPREPALQSDALDRIERVVSAPDTRREALFDAVVANPLDDAARSVLADYLMANGDPRGELIMLQLANAKQTRQRELIRAGGSPWLDGLDGDGATHVQFERGFPARALAERHDYRAPGWRTIEHLTVAGDRNTFVGSPNLRALRVLVGLPASQLSAVRVIGDDTEERALDLLGVVGYEGIEAPTILAPRVLAFEHIDSPRWVLAIRNIARTLHALPVGRAASVLRLGVYAHEMPFAVQLLLSNDRLTAVELSPTYLSHPYARVDRECLRLDWVDEQTRAALDRIEAVPFRTLVGPTDRDLSALAKRWNVEYRR